jgi:hypothetical protein
MTRVERRGFIVGTLALLAAPLAAEAQQASVRAYHVGVLHPAFGERTPALEGLRAGLKAAGLEEGRDVVFDVNFTRGDADGKGPPARPVTVSRGGLVASRTDQ